MIQMKQSEFRPLFGSRPESFFGDKKQFCELIIAKLRRAAGEGIADGSDAEEVLGKYHKEDIIRKAFDAELSLDDLLPSPISLTEEEAACLMSEAEKEGVQAFGIDGELPPIATIARMLLQFKALDQVCAPVSKWTSEKQAFMQATKAELDSLLLK